jgi:hypothetical protein
MTYFIFECNNCDVPPAYLIDATQTVLCGNCRTAGTSKALTNEQVAQLNLPKVTELSE